MGYQREHRTVPGLGLLVRRQHGVIARTQLLGLGLHSQAITHRLRTGRLHRLHNGVYAVGRPELDQLGVWMAAVLACGRGAVLSHSSAAALWEIRAVDATQPISISVPAVRSPRSPGITVHRRRELADEHRRRHKRIPVTSPTLTLVDLAGTVSPRALERAINEADKRRLARTDHLRAALEEMPRRPGIGVLRKLLDRRTFRVTDSELERRFIPLARSAGLPVPETQARVNGFRVDFWWPELGLVVETDGLTYHRTPSQQAFDLRRDQTHTARGLTALRFSHDQIAHEPGDVRSTLRDTARRLQTR